MTCLICRSSHRSAIDHALIGGEPQRGVAGRFGLSKSAIDRHAKHIPATLRLAHDASESERTLDLLVAARGLLVRAAALLDAAEAKGDTRAAVAALRECRQTLDWLARLEGDRDSERNQIGEVLMQTLSPSDRALVADRLEAVGL